MLLKFLKDSIGEVIIFLAGLAILGVFFIAKKLETNLFIESFILWLTAITILIYTRETFCLREASSQQLKETRQIKMNEFLPIIIPSAQGKIYVVKENLVTLQLHNIGKGIARNMHIFIDGTMISDNLEIQAGSQRTIPSIEVNLSSIDSIQRSLNTITLSIHYKDIYERNFVTDKIIFKRIPDGDYVLEDGKWNFVERE